MRAAFAVAAFGAHAALALLHRSGRRGRESRRRRLGRQLVEAGERLGGTIDIEPLDPRYETIGAEDREHKELSLVGAAGGAVRCRSVSGAAG